MTTRLSDYGVYKLYLAIHHHFTKESYDFFKYNGGVNASKEALQKRNDRFFFAKLAKNHDDKDLLDFFVSNALEDRMYAGDLLEEKSNIAFTEFKKRKQALAYVFKEEATKLLEGNPKHAFRVPKDQYPEIVIKLIHKEVSYETAVILDDFVGFIDKFDKHYGRKDFLWGKISLKLRKYKRFLRYDKAKMKTILAEILNKT